MIGRAQLWLMGAALAAAAGLGIERAGYVRGRAEIAATVAAARADLAADLAARDAALRVALGRLDTLRAVRGAEIERIENAARDAPGADRVAFDADSLRRLAERWAEPGAGPAAGRGAADLRGPGGFPDWLDGQPGTSRNPGRPDR